MYTITPFKTGSNTPNQGSDKTNEGKLTSRKEDQGAIIDDFI